MKVFNFDHEEIVKTVVHFQHKGYTISISYRGTFPELAVFVGDTNHCVFSCYGDALGIAAAVAFIDAMRT